MTKQINEILGELQIEAFNRAIGSNKAKSIANARKDAGQSLLAHLKAQPELQTIPYPSENIIGFGGSDGSEVEVFKYKVISMLDRELGGQDEEN